MSPQTYNGPLYWDKHAALILIAGMMMGAGISGMRAEWILGVDTLFPWRSDTGLLLLGIVILNRVHRAAEKKRLQDTTATQADQST